MKFTEKDYAYLNGELFSNGYDLLLNDTSVYARTDKIIDIVRGKACLHVGCCDHIPLIEEKIRQNIWLHGLLEANCSRVVGIDINKEAVDYVNQKKFTPNEVYYADITSSDFIHQIPSANLKIDYVLLGEIIEHVDNPVLFLTSMKENMEKLGFQGEYILTVPNAFCMLRGGKYGQGIECINSDHKYWFTPYTIAKVMSAAGITPKELWFVNYAGYSIKDAYQSDQLIITGISGKPAHTRPAADNCVEKLEDLINTGDFSAALDFIEALPQATQRQWQIQNLTGVVCASCGQFREAETFFTAALAQKPDELDVMYNLADACIALGKVQLAEEMISRCEAQDAEHLLAEELAELRGMLESTRRKRVLMAAYYFPPLSGSGVFRSIKFAKYLPLSGWQPTVISTDTPPNGWNFADESQVAEIPGGVEVIRLPDGISTGRETSLDKERVEAVLGFLRNALHDSPEADHIFQQTLQTQQGIVSMLTFPCGALCWAYDAVQYIEKNLDVRQFEAVYTTSGPSSAHLIGFYLKRKYGIPWVADYRDPWTDNPYGAYDASDPGSRLLFELERILLRQADCNLTIEESLVNTYMDHFGLSQEKIRCITNGYDEADFAGLTVPQKRNEKFTINYSGLLYTQQRSITPILEALLQLTREKKMNLGDIQFRIVGASEAGNLEVAKRYGLEAIIVQTGYISHSDALRCNLNSDLLLLLVGDEAKFKCVYTGKFFEYLRSGRPILALAPKGGAVDRVLRETGHGEAFLSTQVGQIKAMILREYRKWKNGEAAEPLHSPQIERFERKALTRQLAQVLEQAASNGNWLTETASRMPENRHSKYLVICNGGYPTEGNPRCVFAHERVLRYIKAGLNVEAFGFIWGAPLTTYEYQGVKVVQGGAQELKDLLQREQYEKLLIHFLDQTVIYAIQLAGKLDMPMIVWCHGYEVMAWYRCWFNYSDAQIMRNRAELDEMNEARKQCLQVCYAKKNIQFIFVSNWLMQRSRKFVGALPVNHQVVHNFINYDFYTLPDKKPEDRLRILSIKNHATRMYANDLTAKAILELSNRPWFSDLTFELYGDGVLFEENFGELKRRNFPNVHIHQEFLSHEEMRELFRKCGIFLSPTRMDSHPVTTSEAMSAGMSVITSAAGPIREFMDEDCGSLFEFDNYFMMAEEIEYLYFHPDEFLRKSQNAAKRIRTQCNNEETIGREIKLITE